MYNIGQRVKIKEAYDSKQTIFVIESIDFNKFVNQAVYSGIADDGSKVRRVIESWIETL